MGGVEKTKDGERCFRCGAPTDIRLAELWICEPCYEVRSSCCAEFEDEDVAVGEGR